MPSHVSQYQFTGYLLNILIKIAEKFIDKRKILLLIKHILLTFHFHNYQS